MPAPSRSWTLRFVRNLFIWLIPVAILWVLLTPFYNRLLIAATENLLHLVESPDVTSLLPRDSHYLVITRSDLKAKGILYSIRVTDTHFPVLLTMLLFLAVPGVKLPLRCSRLGWALLLSIFFHLLSLFFYVKFAYATQLGSWSSEQYSPFAQNFFGLGKHLLDIPFKLALPFILWMAFHFELISRRNRQDPHI
jgi:hypothetical protein